ncbi:hypothetical protein LLT6_00915 [Lactococcus cremoris subsp. cremoris TIFN6]|uniref:Uncharacterized protein n=1 Tax=Lactococcus cremoris subsp. cremoris TIFN6 TaxID=1234876 RepID=T0TGB9_LACLC|nr:hypothetical protein LLT6_00915 [Lactococcus cremoris subsp. cremoris TIFN6]
MDFLILTQVLAKVSNGQAQKLEYFYVFLLRNGV